VILTDIESDISILEKSTTVPLQKQQIQFSARKIQSTNMISSKLQKMFTETTSVQKRKITTNSEIPRSCRNLSFLHRCCFGKHFL
jgi:hypothetical protein